MKNTWNTIKSIIGKTQCKKEFPEKLLVENDMYETDPQEIANKFNSFVL